MLAIFLISLGVLSRFLVHFNNFTPVLAIALFAGVYLSKRNSLIVPLLMFVVADLFIGFHTLIPFTWGCALLVAVIGWKVRANKSVTGVFAGSLLGAILFYVVTNFGVWLMFNTYPKSMAGLIECYVAAIPYFRGTLAGTLVYSAVLFGTYELAASRIKGTRFANAL